MSEERKIEDIIAENLIYYRKAAGLTQLEIAEKFNYSDKSISKWERAEGMPDVLVLKSLADFYGIKVDDFFQEEKKKLPKNKIKKHWFIVGLSEVLLWLVFGAVYVILSIALPNLFPWWLLFVYASAASFILAVIWSGIYHQNFYQLIATSGIIWCSLASTFLSIILLTEIPNAWLLFTIGIPLEGLAILWFFLKKNSKKNK